MHGIPMWAQAGFWGLVAGGALVIGAAVGYSMKVPQRLIAAIMAFGSGVLISALSFELIAEAYDKGGFASMAVRHAAPAISSVEGDARHPIGGVPVAYDGHKTSCGATLLAGGPGFYRS